jgi:hypothetical protein
MSKPFFPPGPIGFEVHGAGWQQGCPIIHATVAVKNRERPYYQELNFIRVDGRWSAGIHSLDDEENKMLETIWADKRPREGA